jgi:hypothetical protein
MPNRVEINQAWERGMDAGLGIFWIVTSDEHY